ncbi:uncharacterized protein LOC121827994 [Peromyscus maniculatus bairdii]|uniref:uncharacterized protein LOC121827994 n=1 Tax=Peromyscus maniculatus bairdii TaxID=230844 RepID=UPI003FD28C3B
MGLPECDSCLCGTVDATRHISRLLCILCRLQSGGSLRKKMRQGETRDLDGPARSLFLDPRQWRLTKQSSREHRWTAIHLPQTPRPTFPFFVSGFRLAGLVHISFQQVQSMSRACSHLEQIMAQSTCIIDDRTTMDPGCFDSVPRMVFPLLN